MLLSVSYVLQLVKFTKPECPKKSGYPRLSGDDARDDFKILHDQFGVDLSDFEFKAYFPSELSMDAFFLTFRPLLRMIGLQRIVICICDKYLRVTLGMIESAIRQRKWIVE